MKTMPLTAIRSFSAMVERVDLLFFTRVAVATTVTVALPGLARPSVPLRGCDISPLHVRSGRAPYVFPYLR